MAYSKEQNTITKRARWIIAFLIVGFAVLAVRLFNIQILNYDKYQSEVIIK